MMYSHTVLPRSCSKWLNLKVSIALEKLFTVYELGMERVLADNASDKSNHQYYYYVAPVMAELFQIYNKDIPAYQVLLECVDCLQEKQYRNPAAAILLQDFLNVADGTGIDVETVTYKSLS